MHLSVSNPEIIPLIRHEALPPLNWKTLSLFRSYRQFFLLSKSQLYRESFYTQFVVVLVLRDGEYK